jgi:hypothetical protein
MCLFASIFGSQVVQLPVSLACDVAVPEGRALGGAGLGATGGVFDGGADEDAGTTMLVEGDGTLGIPAEGHAGGAEDAAFFLGLHESKVAWSHGNKEARGQGWAVWVLFVPCFGGEVKLNH